MQEPIRNLAAASQAALSANPATPERDRAWLKKYLGPTPPLVAVAGTAHIAAARDKDAAEIDGKAKTPEASAGAASGAVAAAGGAPRGHDARLPRFRFDGTSGIAPAGDRRLAQRLEAAAADRPEPGRAGLAYRDAGPPPVPRYLQRWEPPQGRERAQIIEPDTDSRRELRPRATIQRTLIHDPEAGSRAEQPPRAAIRRTQFPEPEADRQAEQRSRAAFQRRTATGRPAGGRRHFTALVAISAAMMAVGATSGFVLSDGQPEAGLSDGISAWVGSVLPPREAPTAATIVAEGAPAAPARAWGASLAAPAAAAVPPAPSARPAARPPAGPQVTVEDIQGLAGNPIPLMVTAVPAAADQALLIRLAGLPPQASLSSGQHVGSGEWLVGAEEIDGVAITLPKTFSGRIPVALDVFDRRTNTLAAPGRAFIVEVKAPAAPAAAAQIEPPRAAEPAAASFAAPEPNPAAALPAPVAAEPAPPAQPAASGRRTKASATAKVEIVQGRRNLNVDVPPADKAKPLSISRGKTKRRTSETGKPRAAPTIAPAADAPTKPAPPAEQPPAWKRWLGLATAENAPVQPSTTAGYRW